MKNFEWLTLTFLWFVAVELAFAGKNLWTNPSMAFRVSCFDNQIS